MKRYLSPKQFENVANDFEFLFNMIRKSHGELDLRLRDGYFSLYYKGNSLAKVGIKRNGYVVSTHEKFATEDVFRGDSRFDGKSITRDNYLEFRLPSNLLHPFFQHKYLKRLGSNIARVGYSEEITFEQMLITDNQNREDFFIIDRQVTETALRRRRIDLLALRQKSDNQFQFVVIEVKLGNNPDLRKEVAAQLKHYVKHINTHFEDWKAGYGETYRQMKCLGLFKLPRYKEIEILPEVEGLVAVGMYSGIASENIAVLRDNFPEINVEPFVHYL